MFRFTIRDLLWLMVVVAVLVAWFLDRGRMAGEVDRLSGKSFRSPGMPANYFPVPTPAPSGQPNSN